MVRSGNTKTKGGGRSLRISGAEFERIIAVPDSARVRRPEGAEPPKAAQKPDTAEFSAQAQEIAKVKDLLAEIQDVREDRVKELSGKIASGTYKVSNEEIAEMMLRRNTADRVE
jgi:flagellar biosynthesis anti-sigma factor FlgM